MAEKLALPVGNTTEYYSGYTYQQMSHIFWKIIIKHQYCFKKHFRSASFFELEQMFRMVDCHILVYENL